jgi:MFS family permease
VLLLSIFITLSANVLLGFASNFILLFMARLVAGVGSANISVAQAYMADISTPEERLQSMGAVGAMFGIGFLVGPYIGGMLKDISGEGSVFWVGMGAAILNALNLISAYFFLPESNQQLNPDKKRNFNPVSNTLHWIKQPFFSQLMWLFFIYVAAFSIMQITSGLLWKEKYSLTVKQATYIFAFIGITSALFQGLLIGRLAKRYNSRDLIMAGSILMAIGLASIPLPPKNLFLPWELVACGVLSLGNSLITPAVSSWLSRLAPLTSVGQVLGANQSFSSLARVFGPPLGTSLFATHQGFPFF